MGWNATAGAGSGDPSGAGTVHRGRHQIDSAARHEQPSIDRYELPGTIPADGYHVYSHDGCWQSGPGKSEGERGIDWVATDDWLAYDVDVWEAGQYDVTVRVACADAYGGGDFGLVVDDEPQTRVEFEPTGGWDEWTALSTRLELPAGCNTVRLVVFAGGWLFDSLDIR